MAGLLAIPMGNAPLVTGGDSIDGGNKSGIMSSRFRERLFARLPEHDRASRRIPIDEQALHSSGVPLALPFSLRDLARALNGDGTEYRRVHELVDQAEVERFFRADLLAGQNHVQRIGEPDSARQSLRPAAAGNQSQLDFRKTEDGLGMVRSNTVATGKRCFESTTEARAMYRRNYRNTKVLDRIEQHLSVPAQPLRVSRRLELEKLLDVGA